MFPQKEDPMILFAEALFGGDSSNAIERQEKRGQDSLVNSTVLPHKFNQCERWQFEKIGIVFGEQVDDLFTNVTLPPGWKKQPTNHPMWSDLIDDQGRVRAGIFYKAAFYDRSAHIYIKPRYGYGYLPALGYDNPDYKSGGWVGVVMDCGTPIWKSEETEPEPDYNSDGWAKWSDKRQEMADKALKFLDKTYPDWKNPLAYW